MTLVPAFEELVQPSSVRRPAPARPRYRLNRTSLLRRVRGAAACIAAERGFSHRSRRNVRSRTWTNATTAASAAV